MTPSPRIKKNQAGYFLLLAVIFIMVIGAMGSIIAYVFANQARLSVAQQNGLRAFYNAESALEIGTRLLTMPSITGSPSRLSCANVTGTAQVTNAALNTGTFTLTTINSSPVSMVTTLNGALNALVTTIPVSSTSGFAPQGRIMIDKEQLDYTSISGNSFIGVIRGVNSTLASTHTTGARVGQYQCSLDATSGIPNLTAPSTKRELQSHIQLQEAWAVGNENGSNFTFTHWNKPTEQSWNLTNVAGGTNSAHLNAVSLLSHADGWAVGDRAGSNFIFLRWNGSSWALTALAGSCSGQHLLGVSAVSSQQAWAVGIRYKPNCGGGSNYRYTIMRWNGSSWSLLTPSSSPTIPADASTNQNLTAVHVIDTNGDGLGNIGFAVGDSGRILQYNGTNWVQVTSPTTRDLSGVFTVSSSEAWAVGTNGTILRWNGSFWSVFSSPVTNALNAIAMLDTDGDGIANRGWAVGTSGRILSYNGSSWSFVDVGGATFFSVAVLNDQDVWVVGASGEAEHWDGNNWTNIDSDTTRALNGISAIPTGSQPRSAWKQIFH